MGKLAVKTALITLASVICAFGLFIGVCFAFFPAVASDGAYSLGLYETSVSLAEREYKNRKSDEALKVLVERAILTDSYAVVKTYAPEFLKRDTFLLIAEKEGNSFGDDGYAAFIVKGHIKALYSLGEFSDALGCAEVYSENFNALYPYSYLVINAVITEDKVFASEIYASLEKENNFGDEDKQLLEKYKKSLESLING